ncbi:methyltransferase domain-containing protein [Mycobacterium sp. B14F4]|uniref:class I SAM-dependent methyltransferase n=1 Tax=Mycobacterium sp. B14F4 TaxID=3153565 RepID=UPI00325D3B5E
MNNEELVRRFHPEANVGGFSHVDGTVAFYTQIASILRPTDVVLDFGAGRGEPIIDDAVEFRRHLSNLKGRCAHLEGCDIDDAVLQNPYLDHAEVIAPGASLPYPDEHFDIVLARSVLEHVDDPHFVARELMRVTKPGGLIAAITPNKYGYIATGARLVPNRMHVKALESAQPQRKPEDVFPTRYRMNTAAALRRAFGPDAEVNVGYWAAEPAYHFGRPVVYRIIRWLNKHAPAVLQPTLLIYIRKRA